MPGEPLLLAVHVTLALGLTILLGLQASALSLLGRSYRAPVAVPVRRAVTAIPAVTLAVAVTGGALLGSGAHRGPWIWAGVTSAAVIVGTSFWTQIQLRQYQRGAQTCPTRKIAIAQRAAPAFTLAAAFLMAYQPTTTLSVISPLILAAILTRPDLILTRRTRRAS